VIDGIDAAEALEGVVVFHAGTKRDGDALLTAGGRVLSVTAVAPSLVTARERAYAAAAEIRWPGVHYRRDVARRAEP
jgi:phosphoribosylamine--glycine ligase